MTILITRPAPECHQLAQQLNAAGISAIAQPLLDIQPGKQLPTLISQLNKLQSDDFLIAVSVHAVNLAHNYITTQGASWPKKTCIIWPLGTKQPQYSLSAPAVMCYHLSRTVTVKDYWNYRHWLKHEYKTAGC